VKWQMFPFPAFWLEFQKFSLWEKGVIGIFSKNDKLVKICQKEN
jgi:hypothetical protein